MNSFKKILEVLLALEALLLVGPMFIVIISGLPFISSFVSEGFIAVGWIFPMMAILALAPTLIVYSLVSLITKKVKNDEGLVNGNKSDKLARFTMALVTILFTVWAIGLAWDIYF